MAPDADFAHPGRTGSADHDPFVGWRRDFGSDGSHVAFGSHDERGDGWNFFGADQFSAADGTHLVFTVQPTDGTAGQAFSVTVSIEDRDGNVVTTNDSTVKLHVAHGPGGFSTGTTLTATAVNGVAEFDDVILDTAGTYTLSARARSAGRTDSDSFTISPDTTDAEQLAFLPSRVKGWHSFGCDHGSDGDDASSGSSNNPVATDSWTRASNSGSTGTAGEALPAIRVAVKDQFGNIIKSNSASVLTLSINSGPTDAIVDPGSVMTAAVKNGIATFDHVVLDTAGTYTFTATSDDPSVMTATSGSITVKPAAASQLIIAAVTTPQTVGTAVSPGITVTAEDQFGNVVTRDNRTVTLHVANGSPGGFASSSTTHAHAVDGVATFDNILLDTMTPTPAGTMPYFLYATQGSLTSANSNAIEVDAAS
jgi:hypothetical protein